MIGAVSSCDELFSERICQVRSYIAIMGKEPESDLNHYLLNSIT